MRLKVKKTSQAVADTSGMDPEMKKTMDEEVRRRDSIMRKIPRIQNPFKPKPKPQKKGR